MKNSDLVFIVGRARSGTTVLRKLFESHGYLDADEIMHPDINRKHRFYRFVLDQIQLDPGLVTPAKHHKLFIDYLAHLREQSGGSPIAIDLKYFAFNLIPSGELNKDRPFLVRFLQNSGCHVVHLVRRNKLRVHVSERVAQATSKWGASRADQLPRDKAALTLNPAETLKEVQRLEKEQGLAERYLRKIEGRHDLVYEEMFDDAGDFSEKVARIVRNVAQVKDVHRQPAHIRMNPEPLNQLIANFAEISRAFSKTEFAWMVDS